MLTLLAMYFINGPFMSPTTNIILALFCTCQHNLQAVALHIAIAYMQHVEVLVSLFRYHNKLYTTWPKTLVNTELNYIEYVSQVYSYKNTTREITVNHTTKLHDCTKHCSGCLRNKNNHIINVTTCHLLSYTLYNVYSFLVLLIEVIISGTTYLQSSPTALAFILFPA